MIARHYRLPEELVLLRHAQSARNAAKQGAVHLSDKVRQRTGVHTVPDHFITLTEAGKAQAEACRRHFDDTRGYRCWGLVRERNRFDVAYESGYTRAVETADVVLRGTSTPRYRDHRVRERDPGYGYPMTAEEHAAAFPYVGGYWETFGRLFARPPGGESLLDVVDRVDRFLRDLRPDDGRVLIVTHAGTIMAMRFLLEGWGYAEFEERDKYCPSNCGAFRYHRGRLVDENRVAHG